MGTTKTTTQSFKTVVEKANQGDYKLPAFQRKWKWSNKQVMSLYDSLRLGYPIGAFLVLTSPDGDKLSPRVFHSVGKTAVARPGHESLILDGQQRITAGLSIVHGLQTADGNEYYIDLKQVSKLLKEQAISLDDPDGIKKFCEDLDIDSGYLVAKKKRRDRIENFEKSCLLWTPLLTDHYESQLDDILDDLSNSERYEERDIIRRVVKKHLKPNLDVQVPLIELGADFDLSSIAKVFTTINTTGRLLTSFELVVAILYPFEIELEEDVANLKSKFPYYSNMDENGELLLQVVAMLSGKSPKKSELPKNIDPQAYRYNGERAAELLDEVGNILTQQVGLGLDLTRKLIPYDAIFPPMALALEYFEKRNDDLGERGSFYKKLRKWFVSSALMQRYQEGVHNKQTRDYESFKRWIDDDSAEPDFIREAYVSPQIKSASPNGAIGKLFLCLLNNKKPKDPISGSVVGYGEGLCKTEVHHIFPTRWASKGISDWSKDRMNTNLALNTMLLSGSTNGNWLNNSPSHQFRMAVNTMGNLTAERSYQDQMFNQDSLDLLSIDSYSISDYEKFIDSRYRAFVDEIRSFDIHSYEGSNEMDDAIVDLDSPSIEEKAADYS